MIQCFYQTEQEKAVDTVFLPVEAAFYYGKDPSKGKEERTSERGIRNGKKETDSNTIWRLFAGI